MRISNNQMPRPSHLLPDTVAPHELLGDAHGVAVEQLAEERSQRRSVREGQQPALELLDQAICVLLLLR